MEEKHSREKQVSEGLFNTAIGRLGDQLSTTGYARSVSADYIRVSKHFSYWLNSRDAGPREVDESKIAEFFSHLHSCKCSISGRGSYRLCHAALKHFLAVLRELGLAPPPTPKATLPYDNVLQAFQKYLTKVRGTTGSTASLYSRQLKPFLQGIYRGERLAFQEITVRHVVGDNPKGAKSNKDGSLWIGLRMQ